MYSIRFAVKRSKKMSVRIRPFWRRVFNMRRRICGRLKQTDGCPAFSSGEKERRKRLLADEKRLR
jgi:hypothetical protein